MSKNSLAKNVPKGPGCYLFKDEKGDILYIGKAINLQKRVNSYFTKVHVYSKTEELARNIHSVDFIVTNNEIEALLLEARLVHQHQPRFNILLKDDKSYAYIKITHEEFPRFITARTADIKKGDTVYGPYVSGEARKEFLRLIHTLFKLRVCRNLPKRACLLYHIGQCSAPCINKISKIEYLENVKRAEMLLKGKNKELIGILQDEMKTFSKREQYEIAKIRRDQIGALEHLAQKEIVHLRKHYNQDVINYIIDGHAMYIQLFNIHKGVISSRRDYSLDDKDMVRKQDEVFSQFIIQYYFSHDIPKEVIIPKKVIDQNLLKKYLEKISGNVVEITIPRAGNKRKLLDLLKENIIAKHRLGDVNLQRLRELLSLPTYPKIIECFDISNFGSESMVGSMVQFREGKSDKSNYRRFRIKTVRGQSDFDSMKEVVFRRYYRLKQEKSAFPDLVVVDGGRPQLSAALSAFQELGISLPLIGLAKQEEEIYSTDHMHPIKLSPSDGALQLLQRIRNEAHRFANKYHRLLRGKNLFLTKKYF